jgi:hypothetical protein
MNPVIQLDRTGCAVASVAALTSRSYASVKQTARGLGIAVTDPSLWNKTGPMRRPLARHGIRAGRTEQRFTSWSALPSPALLAIKWHREQTGPAWHWVVFVRDAQGPAVLDSKRALRSHRRTDFGRIKPKWFIRIESSATPAGSA